MLRTRGPGRSKNGREGLGMGFRMELCVSLRVRARGARGEPPARVAADFEPLAISRYGSSMEQRFGVDVTALDFGQGGEAEQAAAWLEERPPENLGPRIVLAKRHTTVPALVLVCRREERISGVSAVTVAGNWFLEAGDVESARALVQATQHSTRPIRFTRPVRSRTGFDRCSGSRGPSSASTISRR